MIEKHWTQGFSGAITVCDRQGIILEMNEAATRAFQEQGGASLKGTHHDPLQDRR